MPSATCIGHSHYCSFHGYSAVLTGCPTVVVAGRPLARAGDVGDCESPEKDVIASGCDTVLVGGRAAARRLDPTASGYVSEGERTVQIGALLSPVTLKALRRAARRGQRGVL